MPRRRYAQTDLSCLNERQPEVTKTLRRDAETLIFRFFKQEKTVRRRPVRKQACESCFLAENLNSQVQGLSRDDWKGLARLLFKELTFKNVLVLQARNIGHCDKSKWALCNCTESRISDLFN